MKKIVKFIIKGLINILASIFALFIIIYISADNQASKIEWWLNKKR